MLMTDRTCELSNQMTYTKRIDFAFWSPVAVVQANRVLLAPTPPFQTSRALHISHYICPHPILISAQKTEISLVLRTICFQDNIAPFINTKAVKIG